MIVQRNWGLNTDKAQWIKDLRSAGVAFQSYENIQTFNENLVWTSAPTIYQLVLAPSRSSGRKESLDVAIWCSSHR